MTNKNYAPREHLVIEPELAMITAQTDEGPMIIRMNRGYEAVMGHPDYGYQIGIAVPLNQPNEHGLNEAEEGQELGAIEDALCNALESDKLALFVFSQTSSGVKEWVFYTGDPEAAVARIAGLRQQLTTHDVQVMVQDDPEWETYRNFNPYTQDD